MQNIIDEQNYHAATADDVHHWIRGTDVQHIWRKYGWIPPSEYRKDFQGNVQPPEGPVMTF